MSPIVLTCRNQSLGAWVGLQADVLVEIDASATVDFCTIQYSANYGIWQRSGGVLTYSNNTFVGIAGEDLKLDE